MLDQALKKANLTEQDVKVVEASIDQHEKVWKEEIVDAVITYEPVSSKIINLDGQQIFSSQEAPNLIVDVLAIRPSALKNRNAIKHLIETHFKAKTHFDTNHQDSLYRMAPRMEVQPHEVDHMFKGLYLPDYQNNLRLLSGKKPELLISADLISGILDINFAENQNTEINQIIDDRFLLSLD
jgi:NitT/TauT family transport system substrate-binding protein